MAESCLTVCAGDGCLPCKEHLYLGELNVHGLKEGNSRSSVSSELDVKLQINVNFGSFLFSHCVTYLNYYLV